ncbi:MAG: Hemin uptake protein hemP [Pseudomonadota bacterium]|mgnify:CR=1 FL=1|jgi:hemin uptake protein HemP
MTNQDTKIPTKENSQETSNLIDSKELVGKLGYLNILHEGEVYRLRVTKFRKLILTK